MQYLRMWCEEIDDNINFPFCDFHFISGEVKDASLSTFTPPNLDIYLRLLNRSFSDMGLTTDDTIRTLYFVLPNGEISIEKIRLVLNANTSQVLCTFIETDNTTLMGYLAYAPAITDYKYDEKRGGYLTKFPDDTTNKTVDTRYPYVYLVTTRTHTDIPANTVLCYDKTSNRIVSGQFGGGQPHKTTVVDQPQLVRAFGEDRFRTISEVSLVDPYDNITPSGAGGGFGVGSFEDMGISYPSLPTLSAVDTGFITLYNPSVGELKNLANYMWSPAFSLESFKRLFADPMDVILGCSILPIAIPDGVPTEVTIGNIPTGIYLTRAVRQYEILDCGTITLTGALQSALDYSPNTKTTIYLPFIGAREINTDEIMDKTIGIRYHIDILTGGCVCFINSIFNGKNHIMYQFEGNCANQIPITSSNWTELWATIVRVSSMTGGFSAVGGAGNIGASTLVSGMSNALGNAMASKPRIEHSGTLSGGTGQLGVMTPYLLIESPNESRPNGYNKFEGYPSNITEILGNLSGYTAIEAIHLEGINAPDVELDEIETLLRNGVIL